MVGGVDSGGGTHTKANVLRSSYYIHCFGRLHLVRQAARVLRGLNSQHRNCITQSSDLLPKTRYFGAERTSKNSLPIQTEQPTYVGSVERAARARTTG